MRIVQSCGSVSWGGLEMAALQTAKMMIKRGHAVSVLCRAGSTIEKKAKESGINVVNFGFRGLMPMVREGIDVIHTHLSHDLWTIVPVLYLESVSTQGLLRRFAPRKSGRIGKVKLILTKHMASGVSKKDVLHRILYRRVDKIIAVSEFIKKSVLNTCPVKEDKVIVIPDAVDLTKFNRVNNGKILKREMGINEGEFAIGIAGRMTPGKGYEEFLSAAGRIKERSKMRVKFLAVGGASYGEERYEEHLRKFAKSLGLDNDVIFAGFRADMPEVFSVMDILAFPSHEESFGMTLIEAMAMSVPIVASNNAGITDVIINGKTGILVPPKDYVSLANAVLGLMENEELRKKLGEQGRQRADENFDEEKIGLRIEESYQL